MSNYPQYGSSRSAIVRNATQGGFALAGGVALLIFKGLAGIPILGPIIGGAMLVAGLVTRPKGSSGSKSDRYTSLALTVLGGLAIATIIPGLGGLASFALGASSMGLIGVGVWKLWQYYQAKKRYGG